jgi:hypothetical protein
LLAGTILPSAGNPCKSTPGVTIWHSHLVAAWTRFVGWARLTLNNFWDDVPHSPRTIKDSWDKRQSKTLSADFIRSYY